MLKLTRFGKAEFERFPRVEVLSGDLIPMFAQVKMALPPWHEGWSAAVVVDGNGIQVLVFNKHKEEKWIFTRELTPFPLAVFVAEHLEEPLKPEFLTKLGFKSFKSRANRRLWKPLPFG
jgi:hypothetical protein